MSATLLPPSEREHADALYEPVEATDFRSQQYEASNSTSTDRRTTINASQRRLHNFGKRDHSGDLDSADFNKALPNDTYSVYRASSGHCALTDIPEGDLLESNQDAQDVLPEATLFQAASLYPSGHTFSDLGVSPSNIFNNALVSDRYAETSSYGSGFVDGALQTYMYSSGGMNQATQDISGSDSRLTSPLLPFPYSSPREPPWTAESPRANGSFIPPAGDIQRNGQPAEGENSSIFSNWRYGEEGALTSVPMSSDSIGEQPTRRPKHRREHASDAFSHKTSPKRHGHPYTSTPKFPAQPQTPADAQGHRRKNYPGYRVSYTPTSSAWSSTESYYYSIPEGSAQPSLGYAREDQTIVSGLSTPGSPSPSYNSIDKTEKIQTSVLHRTTTTTSSRENRSGLGVRPMEDRKFACPFHKLNPREYDACATRAFQDMRSINQHLRAYHVLAKPPILNKQRRAQSAKWFELWDQLFPERKDAHPDSPYADSLQVIDQFAQHLTRDVIPLLGPAPSHEQICVAIERASIRWPNSSPEPIDHTSLRGRGS